MLQTIGSINYTLSVLAHWQDEQDIQNTYPYCITDPAERTSEIMEIEKEIEISNNLGRVHGIREERARRKKRTACSTGAAISEQGSRTGGSALQDEGDASGSVPVEGNAVLIYRATTVQILNRVHSVNVLRKIYTMAKRLEELERTGY